MYTFFKKILFSIFPIKSIYRYELFFRFFYYLLFIGRGFHCVVCKANLRQFIDNKKELFCPKCGSIGRTRRLWDIIEKEFLKENNKILDISPSRHIYRAFKKKNENYIASDLSGNFLSDEKYDITNIPIIDNSFDLIICYHVLEHIEKDIKAMHELIRVLNPNGFCIIQTPFKTGVIYENESIKTEKEREKHFGQSDHVRIYSVNGLISRLESVGFNVEKRDFFENKINSKGFCEAETILICSKPSTSDS
ncbi:MAG: class I SAM-dependent methyltransferase [Flavobacteriia bacterium]|nr:class I SAM-dependent methyltransferase [Flavobacteriia bacterium]